MRSIVIVLGTRPEAVKCAPVIWALKADPRFTPIVVSTGQHRNMLDETLDVFGIQADVDLNIMSPRQTLSQVTHRILRGLADYLAINKPDAIMVHGDTATTAAGALAGFHHQIPVIHIEAGLRSGNINSPFPEEANRRLVAQIAALHLAPTVGNSANLIREGVSERSIAITGNTVVDALQWAVQQAEGYQHPILESLADEERPVILASAHRRESWGDPLLEITSALAEIATKNDVRIVVPVHRNPAVKETMFNALGSHPNITLTTPLPYLAFCSLMMRSHIILSDSSGAEEEGPTLGKPTLVLRDVTERPEAVLAGTARLVGRSRSRILDEVSSLLQDQQSYAQMANTVGIYGDGKASERVVGALANFFNEGPPVQPFTSAHRFSHTEPGLATAGS